jgi:hypothetical protein
MRFMHVQQAADLIRAEYEHTPGLQVTLWQAQHLWHLSAELCERAPAVLIRSGFLVPAANGTYVVRAPVSARVDHVE